MQASTASIGHKASFASRIERERLHLPVCRRVLRVYRVIFEADRPYSYQRVVLPLHRLPGLDREFASTATLQEIASRYGLKLGNASERIRIVDAPADAAAHLAISVEQNVLQLDRVTATADGVPIEWRIAYMLADTQHSA
jgi:DNA-binding GntR family transcriptional regulator